MSNFKNYKGYTIYDNGTIIGRSGVVLKQQICKTKSYKRVTLGWGKSKETWLVHRLMAVLFLPNFNNHPTVDHKDRDELHNSLYNLRWASYIEQSHNKKINKLNTSGIKGVAYDKSIKLWRCYFTLNGKKNMKSYKLKEDAIKQRLEWEREYLEN